MTEEKSAGALVRSIREYLGAHKDLCGTDAAALDDAALNLARVALGCYQPSGAGRLDGFRLVPVTPTARMLEAAPEPPRQAREQQSDEHVDPLVLALSPCWQDFRSHQDTEPANSRERVVEFRRIEP